MHRYTCTPVKLFPEEYKCICSTVYGGGGKVSVIALLMCLGFFAPYIQVYRLRLKARCASAATVAKKVISKAATTLGKGRASQKRKVAAIRTDLSKFLSGPSLEFVMSQVNMAHRCPRGRRWNAQQKAFALSLMHSSPKTYRLLRKVFALPSPRLLRRTIQAIQIYPGMNEYILEALRLKTAGMLSQDKVVSLVIDEMSIRQGLSYDPGRDVIEGVAHGSNQLANHAIVFMVRGLSRKWKQPLAYYLSSGPMTGKEMKPLIIECIERLDTIGLTVSVLVCDQGSNNQNLVQTELGVSCERPFFLHGSRKVFVFYDPPHLLKNIRNNLKKYGFTVGSADSKVDVLWKHIESFYEADCSKPVRLAPRLTRTHIDIPPFKNLRVRLAAQILSHSVASGIAFMSQWKIIPGR